MRSFYLIIGLIIIGLVLVHFAPKISFGNTSFGSSLIQGVVKK